MNTETAIQIRSAELTDTESVRAGIQSIAAERRFLATVNGFSFDDVRAFIAHAVDHALPNVVAVLGKHVVGWCNIIPGNGANGFGHVGVLGMGVLPEWRRRGLGRALLSLCIAHARDIGMEKVELEVFADNYPAIRLYESLGFVREGLKARSRKLDGRYQDIALMALWIAP